MPAHELKGARLPAHELKGAAAAERTHERAKVARTSSEDEASAPGGELSMLRRKEERIKREQRQISVTII